MEIVFISKLSLPIPALKLSQVNYHTLAYEFELNKKQRRFLGEIFLGAYVDLKGVKKSSNAAAKSTNVSTSSADLKSDIVFKTIDERMRENVEKAKSVNGIFLYNITKNGQVAKQWSKLIK